VYSKFSSERSRPFYDLLALVERRGKARVVDLGCGDGKLTAELPGDDILGVDSSPEMLARAVARQGLRFEQRALEEVTGSFDLVFSNAAIHWVDNHEKLVPQLFGLVAPGGQICVQLPANYDHPSHKLLAELAGSDARKVPVLDVADYARLLWQAGAADINVFVKVYAQVMPSAAAMVEWQRGTALVPYRARLSAAEYAKLEEELGRRLAEIFPGSPVLFTFKRIFFSARRP
jgi:trans-aconitate 2-methyltransferase